jgi:hypothetical protein
MNASPAAFAFATARSCRAAFSFFARLFCCLSFFAMVSRSWRKL